MRLVLGRDVTSAAYALVAGNYTVSGRMQVYIAADYSTYPSTAIHAFTATVRFSGRHTNGSLTEVDEHDFRRPVNDQWASRRPQTWTFVRALQTTAVRPSYQAVGQPLYFEQSGLDMVVGDEVHMVLVRPARWSLSPRRGIEDDWPSVQVEVFNLRLCAAGGRDSGCLWARRRLRVIIWHFVVVNSRGSSLRVIGRVRVDSGWRQCDAIWRLGIDFQWIWRRRRVFVPPQWRRCVRRRRLNLCGVEWLCVSVCRLIYGYVWFFGY